MPDTLTAMQLHEVDPATLKVADQVRGDATPDDALVDSVRRNGVLQPPIVARNADGDLVIVMGHRRVGAAITAGLTTITVVERAALAGDVERIEDQIVENERRKSLTAKELAAGYQQLELFGRTPEDIATALAEKPERIVAGLRASQSKSVGKLLDQRPTLNLEQAAIIAEFDGRPKYQQEIAETAIDRPQNFSYTVERLRSQMLLQDAISAKTKSLKESGATVVKVSGWAGYSGKNGDGAPLEQLTTESGAKLTVSAHKKCPGHVAWVTGYSHNAVDAHYGCSDWEANGHKRVIGGGVSKTPEQLQAEEERREAHELMLANRAARRQWIHDLLPGKINQLPGVYAYMAVALLSESDYYGRRAPAITLAFLDVEAPEVQRTADDRLDELIASGTVAPFRLMLATSLAIHEKWVADARDADAVVFHFEHLQKWGYTLSDVDETALASARARLAEAAHDDELRDLGQDLDGDPRDEDEEPEE